HLPPGHPPRDEHHLVERRRDETAEADEIRPFVHGRLENPIGGHHHAQIDHLVVVTPEYHANDVLADVVNVTLHRGQHHFWPSLSPSPSASPSPFPFPLPPCLLVHIRKETRDGRLHDARALDDLGQEHLARSEELTHDAHAAHQRTFDHIERAWTRAPGLVDV